MTYDEYKQLLAAGQRYVQQAQAADPEWQAWQQMASRYSPENSDQLPPSPNKDYWAQYMGTLSPEQAAGFQQTMANSSRWQDKVGSVLKYAIPAAVGGAALAGTGLLGTAAQGFVGGAPLGSLGGAGAIGGATGSTGLGGGLFGLGSTDILGGAGAAGSLGSLGGAAGGAGIDWAGNLAGAASGAIGGATGGGGMDLGGLLSGVGGLQGAGSLLTGAAGLANSLKSPATAQTPDYMALAQLQAKLNQEAADKALAANRPDQYDASGNSLTWSQDPVTGKWTQTQKLSAGNQALLDNSQSAQLDALRGVAGRGDFNFQGNPVMPAVGNSKDIQDAWMNLLKPEREMALNGEIQRLKNQGLTEDSPAFQRAMLRQNQADTDAQNKALIAGTSEYGNQFNRSLLGRQQAFGEYQTDYNAPMQQYQGLMGIAQPQGQFGSFTQAQNPGGAPVYNAGQDQYTANLANANAKNAQNNNLTQGLFGLSGAIAKGGWGP